MADPLTPEDLAAIKARADSATPGPWEHRQAGTGIRGGGTYDFIVRPGGKGIIAERHADGTAEDAEFIAHSREDVDRLHAEVLRLRARLERVAADALTVDGQVMEEASRCGECGEVRDGVKALCPDCRPEEFRSIGRGFDPYGKYRAVEVFVREPSTDTTGGGS